MGATSFLAGAELKRRARMWVLLAVAVGLLGGTALATAAGARRTASAFDRFVTWSHNDDASVLGFGAPPGALDRVAALPQVADSLQGSLVMFHPHGSSEPFAYDTALIVTPDERFIDGTYFRPITVDGRAPDLTDDDEVLVNESMADRLGLRSGDELGLDIFTSGQIAEGGEGAPIGAPEGPQITATIAGVVRSPLDLTETAAQGLVYASGAFYERWADDLPLEISVLSVKLRSRSQIDAFSAEAVSIVEGADVQVSDSSAATDATRVQAIGLVAFSAIIAATALVALGQALSRASARDPSDQVAWVAAGMTRQEQVRSEALPALIVTAAGSVLAVATAVAASPLFPRGLARRAEPHPGVDVDIVVLGLGGTVLFLALGAWVVVASRIRSRDQEPLEQRVPLADRLAQTVGASLAASVGVRFALGRGRGSRATPNPSAVTAVVCGLIAVVAVVVFGASLAHLLAEPGLGGSPWDAEIGTIPDPMLAATAAELDAPAFGGLATIRSAQVGVGGTTTEAYGFDVIRGSGFITLLAGREPQGPDEAVFGSHTLDRLGLDIGDTVEIGTASQTARQVRIVGRATLPVLNEDIDRIADGVILTREGLDAVVEPSDEASVTLVVRFGDDPARAQDDLEAIASRSGASGFPGPTEPRELANMRPVGGVLAGIGILAGLIAILSIAHLSIVTVRRRGGELAVLRALGFSPRQLGAVVRWQAVIVAAIAGAIAVPFGIVVGSVTWTAVTDLLGVGNTVVIRGGVLALTVAGLLASAVVVSIRPASRAAHIRTTDVLRTD